MSRTQIHTDVVQRLKEAGYEMDVDGNFICVGEDHTQNEEDVEVDSKVILPTDPNWYEELLNKRELEELAKYKEVNNVSKSERLARTTGKAIAKTELWAKDSGIPAIKKGSKEAAKATVKAGKALRRFGKGLAEGYKQAKNF